MSGRCPHCEKTYKVVQSHITKSHPGKEHVPQVALESEAGYLHANYKNTKALAEYRAKQASDPERYGRPPSGAAPPPPASAPKSGKTIAQIRADKAEKVAAEQWDALVSSVGGHQSVLKEWGKIINNMKGKN